MRRYLLGELDVEEQRLLEEQLMSRDESFEELLAAEDELIDSYVGGTLSARERERFEHHFLATPERRRKLSFARTLRKYIADAEKIEPLEETGEVARPAARTGFPPPFLSARNPLAAAACAAVLLLVFIGGAWFVMSRWREGPRGSAVVAVTLAPGQVRDTGGGIKRVPVAPDTGVVELRLALDADERERYRAEVRTLDEGRVVFDVDELRSVAADAGRVVVLNVPAGRLAGGDYRVKLSGGAAGGGFEEAGTYYFRVNSQ